MLFYLGYLTIAGEVFERPELIIPNNVMKELYASYFMDVLSKETNIEITENENTEIIEEMTMKGKIDKIVGKVENYLENLSNRDYIEFNEKHIKLMFYCIVKNLPIYVVKSEMEVQRRYIDMLLIPKDKDKGYNSIMIEFKYLKKSEERKLQEKQAEARKQIEEYGELEEIKEIPNLHKYTVVAVNSKLYVEEV